MLLFRQELNTVTSAAVIVIRGQIHHRQARQQPSLLPYDPSLCYISTTRTAPNSPKPLHITLICPCTLHACCLPHASVACALRRNCGLPPATATITNSACRRPQHRTPAPCLSNSTPQSSVSSVSNASTHFCAPILSVAGPFQQEVSQTLRLKNPHSDPVAFKVSRFQHAAVLCKGKPLSGKLTTAGQNHRAQAVRTDPHPLLPPCQLTNGFSDTAYDRTADALSPGEMSKYRVRWPHALLALRTDAGSKQPTNTCIQSFSRP